MIIKPSLSILFLSAAVTLGAPLFAQHGEHPLAAQGERAAGAGKLVRVTEKEAAWAEKARANYPLDVCLTSDEKLGSMGKSPEYIYRVAGQPDRLVIFCCDGCEEDFMKAPAKYLAKIDQAAKSKQAPAKKSDQKRGHGHD